MEAFTPELIQRQFDVNVFGPMRVSRAFLPGMRERGHGLVVYVSSVVGRLTIPFGGVYASSKWALEALAETSSYELAPFGVEVAIVQPGAYGTNISNSRVGPDDAERVRCLRRVDAVSGERFRRAERIGGGSRLTRDRRGDLRAGRTARRNAPAAHAGSERSGRRSAQPTHAEIQRSVLETFGVGELLPKIPALV